MTENIDIQTSATINKQIQINSIPVPLRCMYKQYHSKLSLLNGVVCNPQTTNFINYDSNYIQPFWSSETAIIFLSGAFIYKYDFITEQYKCMRNIDLSGGVYFLKSYRKSNQEVYFAYLTLSDSFYYKMTIFSDRKKKQVFELDLNNTKFQTPKSLQFFQEQSSSGIKQKFALITENKQQITLTIGVINHQKNTDNQQKTQKKLEIKKQQQGQQAIILSKFYEKGSLQKVFGGFNSNSIFAIERRSVKLIQYSDERFCDKIIQPLLLEDRINIIHSNIVYENERILIVTNKSIKLIRLKQQKFKQIQIEFPNKLISSDLNGNSIIASNMQISLSHVAIYSKIFNTLLIYKFDIHQLQSNPKSFHIIQISLQPHFNHLHHFIISPKSQNILLFGQTIPEIAHSIKINQVKILSIDLFLSKYYHQKSYINKTIFQYVPTSINYMTSSLVKNQILYVNDKSIAYLGMKRTVHFQNLKCCHIDCLGLFLLAGYQYCFKLFAIKSSQLVMLFSEPVSNIISLKFNIYGQIFIVLLKNQIIIFNARKFQRIYTYILESKSQEFVKFQIQQNGRQAVFFQSDGNHFIFSLTTYQKIRTLKFLTHLEISKYDFLYDIIINYNRVQKLQIYSPKTQILHTIQYLDNLNITSIQISNDFQVIYLGTEDGRIRAHLWPLLHPSQFIKNFTEVKVFTSSVTNLNVSRDGACLYATSKNGIFVKLKLQYFSDGNPISQQLKVNRINYHGIGFYKYYMDNLMLQSLEENQVKNSQIQNLEDQKQRRHAIYKEQILNLQNQNEKTLLQIQNNNCESNSSFYNKIMNIQEIESNKNDIRKRLGIYQNQNYIKDAIFNLEQQFTKKYIQIVQKNNMLEKKLQQNRQKYAQQYKKVTHQYKNQKQNIHKIQSKILQKRNLILKQHQEVSIQQINQLQLFYSQMFHSFSNQIHLNDLENQKNLLFKQTDKMRVAIKLIKIQKQKFQSKLYDSKQIMKKLQDDLEIVKQDAEKKKKIRLQLEGQLIQLQNILQQNQNKQKFISKKAHIYSQNTSSIIYDLQNLQKQEIAKMRKELQDFDRIHSQLLKNLTSEALQSKRFEGQINERNIQKTNLKKILSNKKNKLRQTKYKFNQFLHELQITKVNISKNGVIQAGRSYRIKKCSQFLSNKPELQNNRKTLQIQSNHIQNKKFFQQKNIQFMIKKGLKNMQNHFKQNQTLIQYLNQLNFVQQDNKKKLKKLTDQFTKTIQISNKLQKSLNTQDILKYNCLSQQLSSPTFSTNQSHFMQPIKNTPIKTPFQMYHENKSTNKNEKFVKKADKNKKQQTISKSTKVSIWNNNSNAQNGNLLSVHKISKSIYGQIAKIN